MGPAGDLGDRGALTGAVGIELVEARISVGVEIPRKALEMSLRADALAIRGVAIEDGGRCITGMGALVADIDPKPPRRGLAEPGSEHRHGGSAGPAMACLPIASARGVSSAAADPTQSARVERSKSTPSRAGWGDRRAPVNPLQQNGELRRRQSHHAIGRHGPDEAALLQPLGEQAEA